MFPLLHILSNRTPLGFLQLKHEPLRMLVSIAGILFADTLMFMQLGIMASLYDANTMLHKKVNADIVIVSKQAQQLINMSTFPRRRVLQARDVDGVEQAKSCYLSFSGWRNPDSKEKTFMLIVGFDPSDNSFDLPELNKQLEKIKLPDKYIFDRGTRGNYKTTISAIENGKEISTEIERRTIKLSGLCELGASFATDGALFTSDQNFLRLFPRRSAGQVSIGLIRVKPGYDVDAVAKSLRARLADDVRVFSKAEFAGFEKNYIDSTSHISVVFGAGTFIGFIVGIVLVYQVLSTDVNDHLAEYATFKAMGYSNRYLYGVLLEEIAILATIGFIPSVAVAMGLYYIIQVAGTLPVTMTIDRLMLIFVLTIAMCAASAFIASRKLRSADPAEIF
ncbi:MAG: ABC transporter permease DevC [Candidatus Obscuribacterales bacterium]|nr:ABC transporter permease DevC [Candidatus Obscuribacterales bacterium]